jgi:hypothetical protein
MDALSTVTFVFAFSEQESISDNGNKAIPSLSCFQWNFSLVGYEMNMDIAASVASAKCDLNVLRAHFHWLGI